MDRRTFLISSGAVAATATQSSAETDTAAPALRQLGEPITVALGARYQGGYMRDRADRFALRLKELSGGRLSLAFVADDQGDLTAVAQGRTQAYFGTEADHVALDPAFAYFSGLPGELGLSGTHVETWLKAGSGQMLWDRIADQYGVKALPVGHSGATSGLWAKTDLDRLADLKGLRIDASLLTTAITERLGAVPAHQANPDVRELPMGVTAAIADGVARDHKVWFRDGIHRHGIVLSFGMNAAFWHALTDADRAVVTACANEAYHQNLAEHEAHDKTVAPHLVKAHGVQRRQLPDDIRRAIAHVADQYLNDAAAQHAGSAYVHESYMQFRQSFVGEPSAGHASGLV